MQRFSICNEVFGDLGWEDQCRLAREAGFGGIEIAPFSLVDAHIDELSPSDRQLMLRTMHDEGIACVGLHWLLAAPPEGLHFSTADAGRRMRTMDYLRRLMQFCADLEGDILVFGSPAQRTCPDMNKAEATSRFAEGLAELAPEAAAHSLVIAVEPIASRYTNVVNTVADARQVVEAVGHPAVRFMFDFHNAEDETMPILDLIERNGSDLVHVHVQDRGTLAHDRRGVSGIPRNAFTALRHAGYNGWISLETFKPAADPRRIASSFEMLRAVA